MLATEYVYEPVNYQEAISDPDYAIKWKKAIQAELDSLKRNGMWTMEDLPVGRKPVRSKWVFKVKYRDDGTIEKFKGRVVAQGFSQVYGVDYEETFAPTVRYDILRLLFAITAIEDLEMHQMDVISTYLAGDLNEEIYMHPPEGYDTGEGKYCHLRKSIYGLK